MHPDTSLSGKMGMVNSTQPFLLGVNYWPRRKAMYWWRAFDAAEVADEFALIRDLGLGIVRIFLLWDDFQPTPDAVSRQCLDNLQTVCEIAAQNRLTLNITFFTGHMSGPNWAPRWLLDEKRAPESKSKPVPGDYGPPHGWIRQVISNGKVSPNRYRNPFQDPQALQAERLLLKTISDRLKDHPAIGMWNLGNEPDLFAWPKSAAAGRAWAHQMVALLHEVDSKPSVTCGLHTDSLLQDNGLRVHEIFAETDIAVMHAYPMYADWALGPLDPDFVPFTCALTAALCGKPVLMEEFGGPTAPPGQSSQEWEWEALGLQRKQFMASEEDLAKYLNATLQRLLQVGALGALLWCFADYSPDLWDSPPCSSARHERHFGLLRPDGSPKPHAEIIRQFAATQPIVQPIPAWARLQIEPEDYYQNPAANAGILYQQYLRKKSHKSSIPTL